MNKTIRTSKYIEYVKQDVIYIPNIVIKKNNITLLKIAIKIPYNPALSLTLFK